MSDQYLMVRFLRLPADVTGPSTRWSVALECCSKGGSRASITARCLNNGKVVELYQGRTAVAEQAARNGFLVRIGTIKCKIMSAAVAQGCAEFIAGET